MNTQRSTRLYITFYTDENITLDLARMLAKENCDVLTAHDAGMLGKSDPEQLEYATQCGRAIVTHNRNDFLTLYDDWFAKDKNHFGIIVLIRRDTLREMAERLLVLLDTVTFDEMENQLRFV